MDGVEHYANKIECEGDSMRKKQSSLARKTEPVTEYEPIIIIFTANLNHNSA